MKCNNQYKEYKLKFEKNCFYKKELEKMKDENKAISKYIKEVSVYENDLSHTKKVGLKFYRNKVIFNNNYKRFLEKKIERTTC